VDKSDPRQLGGPEKAPGGHWRFGPKPRRGGIFFKIAEKTKRNAAGAESMG
jgi:hypothetical protein